MYTDTFPPLFSQLKWIRTPPPPTYSPPLYSTFPLSHLWRNLHVRGSRSGLQNNVLHYSHMHPDPGCRIIFSTKNRNMDLSRNLDYGNMTKLIPPQESRSWLNDLFFIPGIPIMAKRSFLFHHRNPDHGKIIVLPHHMNPDHGDRIIIGSESYIHELFLPFKNHDNDLSIRATPKQESR